MRYLKRSWLVMLSVVALVATAGMAAAANNTPTEDDTLLNIGYDEANQVFIADLSGANEPYDCTLEDGTLMLGYGDVTEDGTVPVITLDDELGTVEFGFRPADEVGDEYTPADAPALYTGPDGECGLFGTAFEGVPDHGDFMTAFNQYLAGLDIQGRGCVVRILAQSELGKGAGDDDEATEGGDDEAIAEEVVEPAFVVGDTGEVDFSTHFADCSHGKPEFGDDHPGQGGSHPNSEDHPGQGDDHPTPEDHPGHHGKP